MADIILHHEGKFVIYSTSMDSPVEGPFDLQQLEDWYAEEAAQRAREEIAIRAQRAIKTGSSSFGGSLESVIATNRAGLNDTRLSKEQFIQTFFSEEERPIPVGSSIGNEAD